MKKLLLLSFLALTACASVGAPETPAQGVFTAKAAYATALTIAVAYKGLPSCALPAHPPLCSDAAIVKELQDKDDIAAPSLNAAEAAVRAPNVGGGSLETFVRSAKLAVGLLTAITDNLKVK